MSEKTRFIRHAALQFVTCHHAQPDVDRAITYAEALWKKLSARGYGTQSKQDKPRQSKDWYKQLSPMQQRWFLAFWQAFNHKQGRNEAAMRWGQLGNLTEPQYRMIVKAAKEEANRTLPQGQVRKMAQGWLQERRWEDHTTTETDPAQAAANKKREALQEIAGELAHAKQMQGMNPDDDYWKSEVQRIETRLNELKNS